MNELELLELRREAISVMFVTEECFESLRRCYFKNNETFAESYTERNGVTHRYWLLDEQVIKYTHRKDNSLPVLTIRIPKGESYPVLLPHEVVLTKKGKIIKPHDH